ncbi:MAG TPA: diguanylate cyclase response regulator, partial [Treponema sp.]|nr:diguanylate cyclase response regulator [Treponema sp.]
LSGILTAEYTVFSADSGVDGLNVAREKQPDLIVLNARIPGMDGFEVFRRIREDRETKTIPVMIVDEQGGDADEEKGLLMGAADYIAGPLRAAVFLARVKVQFRIVSQLWTAGRLGFIDPLTDIPNRRCFDGRLSIEWPRAIRHGSVISFLMIDVDKFKNYNDTWGHQQGDEMLKSIARVFSFSARRSGDLAARIGGEEFGVLLADTNISSAVRVAEEIRRRVESLVVPTADGLQKTGITVSIGATSCRPDKAAKISDFLLDADKKLYRAKALGRNRVFFEPENESLGG